MYHGLRLWEVTRRLSYFPAHLSRDALKPFSIARVFSGSRYSLSNEIVIAAWAIGTALHAPGAASLDRVQDRSWLISLIASDSGRLDRRSIFLERLGSMRMGTVKLIFHCI